MELPTQTANSLTVIEIARTAVVRHDERLLVLRRAANDDWNPGGPDLPGGEVGEGETRLAAAGRENAEETGIVVARTALRHVCTVETFENDELRGPRTLRRTFYATRVHDPEPSLSEEHEGHDWLSIDEAEAVFQDSPPKLICLEGVRKLLAAGELPLAS